MTHSSYRGFGNQSTTQGNKSEIQQTTCIDVAARLGVVRTAPPSAANTQHQDIDPITTASTNAKTTYNLRS